MTRREALSLIGVSAVSGRAAQRVLVAGHPWVYAATRPKFDVYEILDSIFADMSYAGMDAIELMNSCLAPDGCVERIKSLSARHGLPVLGASYGAAMWNKEKHEEILAEARVLIPRLSAMGGRALGTSVGKAPKPKTDAQLDAQAALLKQLIRICSDHGVVLNLHNHTYEVENAEHDLSGTLARLPDVKLGPDFNWLIRGGVDPVDFIRRRGRNIVFGHLRDQKPDGKWPEAMGEGSTDYAAIAKALREAGFQGDLAIELAHEKDTKLTRPLRESLRISRDYVRRTMGW